MEWIDEQLARRALQRTGGKLSRDVTVVENGTTLDFMLLPHRAQHRVQIYLGGQDYLQLTLHRFTEKRWVVHVSLRSDDDCALLEIIHFLTTPSQGQKVCAKCLREECFGGNACPLKVPVTVAKDWRNLYQELVPRVKEIMTELLPTGANLRVARNASN